MLDASHRLLNYWKQHSEDEGKDQMQYHNKNRKLPL